MLALDAALMSSHQPSPEQRDNLMNAGHDHVGRIGTVADDADLMPKPPEIVPARRLVAKPRLKLLKRPRVINPSDGMLRAFHPPALPVVPTCVKGIPTFVNNIRKTKQARIHSEFRILT